MGVCRPLMCKERGIAAVSSIQLSSIPPFCTASPCSLQVQSFDQDFENMNKALKLSCVKGLPVRVVRSFKASDEGWIDRMLSLI